MITGDMKARLWRAARFGILALVVAAIVFGFHGESALFVAAYALMAMVISSAMWFIFDPGRVPPNA